MCPICGMSLVEKKISEELVDTKNIQHPEVFLQSSVINNLGIKTENVVRGNINRDVRVYGYVNQIKKRNVQQLISPVSGVVRYINNSSDGNKFYKGEVAFKLQSDEALQLQNQYLSAIRENDLQAMRITKKQLGSYGYSFQELESLAKNKIASIMYTYRYPYTGLLTDFKIKLKQEIKAGEEIGILKPLYSISVSAKVFESQWIWLKEGQAVSMSIRNLPGVTWKGEVISVGDLGKDSTTAVKLQADFEENEKVELRLGMQTEMIVNTESKNNVLQVPSSAVIRTGSKNVVVIAKDDGHFQPVDVETGLDNDEYVEIISGVEEGMKVVVSGQFLLDSESELRAEISRLGAVVEGFEH